MFMIGGGVNATLYSHPHCTVHRAEPAQATGCRIAYEDRIGIYRSFAASAINNREHTASSREHDVTDTVAVQCA
eukprot:gene1629-biopygen1297